jgi:hypothetical protein
MMNSNLLKETWNCAAQSLFKAGLSAQLQNVGQQSALSVGFFKVGLSYREGQSFPCSVLPVLIRRLSKKVDRDV